MPATYASYWTTHFTLVTSFDYSEVDEHAPELPVDQIFDVLADSSRRYTLSYLQEHSQPVAIADLAAAIVAQQQKTSIEAVTDEALDREYTVLHHQHLPKLEDANLIRLNDDRNTVEAVEVHPVVNSFLALATSREQ